MIFSIESFSAVVILSIEQIVKRRIIFTKKKFIVFPYSLVIRFRCEAKDAQCPLGDKFGCDAENEATSLMLLAKSLNLKVLQFIFNF